MLAMHDKDEESHFLFLRSKEKRCSTPPLSLIDMMSRSCLILSGSVSTGARLRFSGRFHLDANRLEL